jgi:hypothetical protein
VLQSRWWLKGVLEPNFKRQVAVLEELAKLAAAHEVRSRR